MYHFHSILMIFYNKHQITCGKVVISLFCPGILSRVLQFTTIKNFRIQMLRVVLESNNVATCNF